MDSHSQKRGSIWIHILGGRISVVVLEVIAVGGDTVAAVEEVAKVGGDDEASIVGNGQGDASFRIAADAVLGAEHCRALGQGGNAQQHQRET
ncbi:MAG: hypothetical protein K0U98_25105 [Deltaproteobacteria bacterium]|nr:hypothetical protein [Deltaproteobacteria bacterium]